MGRVASLKKVQVRALQFLLGKMNFACRIMPIGRTFSCRLAAATAGVSVPHHFVRLGGELRGDLRNRGLIELYTDAAGSSGFGDLCQDKWCTGQWPDSWVECAWVWNLALLELWRQWQEWCCLISFGKCETEVALLLYVCHCKEAGWSVSRIQRCMAGLTFGFKLRGSTDYTKSFLVSQALKGWQRRQVVEDQRRPVSS